ncbi:MAG: type II toxin-antitoxin system HipA family toxin [Gemmatimonadaceae bacterium]
MSQPAAYVDIDLPGGIRSVGRLWSHRDRNGERASFEFDQTWLVDPIHHALGPALPATSGSFHTAAGRALFGALGDSAPDRWGRRLITRNEARRARIAQTTPRAPREIDFLLGVTDIVRQGALRFRASADGPYVAADDGLHVPPLVELPALLSAANVLAGDPDSLEADNALLLLLAPGSSLGGARPKASVRDRDGSLAIAKFPERSDSVDVIRWEWVMLLLAERAGIDVCRSRLEDAGGAPVLLLTRFDRRGTERVPFLSAMSLLDASDGEHRSYVEIFDGLRQVASRVNEDGRELWRRMAFNILASNLDDHLRNHAVLYDGSGWRLSPAYDLNPVPGHVRARELTTAINVDGDATASLELAVAASSEFLLTPREAREIAVEVAAVTKTWREVASRVGVAVDEIRRMATAFEHDELELAKSWN